MGIKYPWNTSELARTLCLAESTNSTKIKLTHKVVGAGCIWKEYHLLILAESISQCSIKF